MAKEELSWFRMKSWHILRGHGRDGRAIALCGKHTGSLTDPPKIYTDRDRSERSCENCLRIIVRD